MLLAEEEYRRCAINDLEATQVGDVIIKHVVEITMLDGKAVTALSDATNSSMCCPVCGAKPTEMNDISAVKKRPYLHESLKFGMSTLYAWIRFMECIYSILLVSITPENGAFPKIARTQSSKSNDKFKQG